MYKSYKFKTLKKSENGSNGTRSDALSWWQLTGQSDLLAAGGAAIFFLFGVFVGVLVVGFVFDVRTVGGGGIFGKSGACFGGRV